MLRLSTIQPGLRLAPHLSDGCIKPEIWVSFERQYISFCLLLFNTQGAICYMVLAVHTRSLTYFILPVRQNSDGTLNYLGRKDAQVKLHGQRIELLEIEHHIKEKMPELRQVAVELVAPAGHMHAKKLAAFLCFDRELEKLGNISEPVLRLDDSVRTELLKLERLLAELLPSYMVPSMYIPLQGMPLSSAGKLNRKKLREIVGSFSEQTSTHYSLSVSTAGNKAPSSPMEKVLETLWENVLHLKKGGVYAGENFFRIGGDSLGAMKLAIAAREVGISLTVADVFKAPRLCDMACVIGFLDKDEKTEVVEPFSLLANLRNLSQLLKETAIQCQLEQHRIQDIYPCTPLQEGLMVLGSKEPGAYMSQIVFKMADTLDLDRFKDAWNYTAESTDILRTRIIHDETLGSLQVVVQEDLSWETSSSLLRYLDMNKKSQMSYGAQLARYALVEDPQGRYFVWTAHHSIFDGWCLPLVLKRVSTAYDGALFPTLRPYKNFIQYLQTIDPNDTLLFWRSHLAGVKPTNFPQLTNVMQEHSMEETLNHEMEYSHLQGSSITMSNIVRSAWALVVGQNSSSNDFTFGATVTGRNAPVLDIGAMIGPTITTVPIRVCLNMGQPLEAFLQAMQDQAIEMIPFEHTGLQNIMKLGPDEMKACEFKNLLVIQPLSEKDPLENTMDLQSTDLGGQHGHTYPLLVECQLGNGVIEFTARYNSSIISSEETRRLFYQFEYVIRQLTENTKDKTVGSVDLFSPQDKAQVWAWNRDAPESIDHCIHEAIGWRVATQPNEPAVCSWDENFTYAELDDLSTRLGHYLVTLDVGPEKIVPLCFEKSAWTVVAMVAVLKAGGAFLNLDTTHPTPRLERIARDVKATVVLSSIHLTHLLSNVAEITVPVTRFALESMPVRESESCSIASPQNAAYVVFSSGSTGSPKGSLVEHSAFTTSALAHGKAHLTDATSRVLQFGSHSFDGSLVEILTTLIHGGCVCIPSEHERTNDIVGAMRRMKVNWAALTPSFVRQISPHDLPELKTLLLAGEAMSANDILVWGSKINLVNAYGPSECSVSTVINSSVTPGTDPANVGFPCGVRVWITDQGDHEKLAPIGCIGELCIEGPTLARGYFNNKEATAKAFVENPTWLTRDANGRRRRVYKTGDVSRSNPLQTLC
jgi:amino acid adenylation domain-containing protein